MTNHSAYPRTPYTAKNAGGIRNWISIWMPWPAASAVAERDIRAKSVSLILGQSKILTANSAGNRWCFSMLDLTRIHHANWISSRIFLQDFACIFFKSTTQFAGAHKSPAINLKPRHQIRPARKWCTFWIRIDHNLHRPFTANHPQHNAVLKNEYAFFNATFVADGVKPEFTQICCSKSPENIQSLYEYQLSGKGPQLTFHTSYPAIPHIQRLLHHFAEIDSRSFGKCLPHNTIGALDLDTYSLNSLLRRPSRQTFASTASRDRHLLPNPIFARKGHRSFKSTVMHL